MQIAKAKRGDVREISNCRKEAIVALRKFYSREGLNTLLLNCFEEYILKEINDGEVFCLIHGEEIIGNVTLSGKQISGLYIKPKYAGQGYGQKLLEFIENVCKVKGILEIEVYATINAKNFYLHNGFFVEGFAYSISFSNPIKFFYMKKKLGSY